MPRRNDLFLSYSSKDRDFVARLAKDLKSRGLGVWWDAWEMKVGDSLNTKIQEGIKSSAWFAVVLSPASVSSSWVQRELNAGLVDELARRNVFVLPLLYKDCDFPLFLKDKVYADFRTSYAEGLQTLLDRFSGVLDDSMLARLLSDDHAKVLSAYSEIPAPEREGYVSHLVELLSGSSSDAKMAALFALYTIGHKSRALYLHQMLNDGSNAVRRRAVFLMGESRSREFAPVISALLSDSSPDVRAAARDAAKKIPGGEKGRA